MEIIAAKTLPNLTAFPWVPALAVMVSLTIPCPTQTSQGCPWIRKTAGAHSKRSWSSELSHFIPRGGKLTEPLTSPSASRLGLKPARPPRPA